MRRLMVPVSALLATGSMLLLAACGSQIAALTKPAARTTVTQKVTAPPTASPSQAAPQPAPTRTRNLPAPVPAPQADTYAQDIWNAGITAPQSWIDSTGQTLCADWNAGDTTAATDPILLAGGIYPEHLAIYDSITAQDICPDAPGGP
jgi:hypothetical protein